MNKKVKVLNIQRGIKRKDEEDFKREEKLGINLSKYKFKTKRMRRMIINNCTEPELGKYILYYAINPIKIQKELFI